MEKKWRSLILDKLNIHPRRRKSPEMTLVPEAGAVDVCASVLDALGIKVDSTKSRSLHMNGMRAGFNPLAGVFFIDEPHEELGRQIGIKSNGVHVEMYDILDREEPDGKFKDDQTDVTFEQVDHFVKVASWLKKPDFDIRQFPLKPPKA